MAKNFLWLVLTLITLNFSVAKAAEPQGEKSSPEELKTQLIQVIDSILDKKQYSGHLQDGRPCELNVSPVKVVGKDLELKVTLVKTMRNPEKVLSFKLISYDPKSDLVHASINTIETSGTKKISAHVIENDKSIYQTVIELIENDLSLKSLWLQEDHQDGQLTPAAHCIFIKNKLPNF